VIVIQQNGEHSPSLVKNQGFEQQVPRACTTLARYGLGFRLRPPLFPTTTFMALPTNGRVIVETTAGEIDIELWSKVTDCDLESYGSVWVDMLRQETPKTCRNFLALAMEGM
jgi:hypothetical protein